MIPYLVCWRAFLLCAFIVSYRVLSWLVLPIYLLLLRLVEHKSSYSFVRNYWFDDGQNERWNCSVLCEWMWMCCVIGIRFITFYMSLLCFVLFWFSLSLSLRFLYFILSIIVAFKRHFEQTQFNLAHCTKRPAHVSTINNVNMSGAREQEERQCVCVQWVRSFFYFAKPKNKKTNFRLMELEWKKRANSPK